MSADGVRIVFGSRLLLTLLLIGWLAGFYIVPEGLTAATMLAMSWTHLRGRLIQATERTGEP